MEWIACKAGVRVGFVDLKYADNVTDLAEQTAALQRLLEQLQHEAKKLSLHLS